MNQSQLVAKNTLVQIATKATTAAIGLLTRKLLAYYLGPAGLGDYIFALTYATLFGGIADWGTLMIAVREAAKRPTHQAKIFGSALVARLGLSLLAVVVALGLLPILRLPASLAAVTTLATALIVAFALKASLGIIFEAKLRMEKWFWVDLTASLVTLGLFALGVYLRLSLAWFFGGLLLATAIAITVAGLLARRLTAIDLVPDLALTKQLGLEALPMGGVLMMFNVYNRVDTLILKFWRTSVEVGFYGLAYFIYENIILVAAYLVKSVLPLLSPQVSTGRPTANFSHIYQKTWDLMLALALAAVAGTFVLAPLLVNLVSSPQFAPSVPLLRVLAIGLFLAFLNHVTGFSLVALGRQKIYLGVAASALIFNVTANWVLIPVFGATAAAWVTVGTEGLVQVLTLVLISRSLGRWPSLVSFPKTAWEFIKTRGKIF